MSVTMRLFLLLGLAVFGANAQYYQLQDCVCEERCRYHSDGCCPPQDCPNPAESYFPYQPETQGCQNPGPIENGYISSGQANFNVGDKVTYSCRKGYKLEGNSEQVCTSSLVYFFPFSAAPSWVPEDKPECIDPCHRHSCDIHASCVPDHDGVEYKCRCHHGYFGDGYNCKEIFPCESNPCDANAKCTDIDARRYKCDCNYGYTGNGKICRKITCPAPPFPANANYRPVQKTYSMGSTITYECDYGYILVGRNSERKCTANGKFTGFAPKCVEITCPAPPFPANANYRPVQKTYPMGSTIIYECDYGYILVGRNSERKCTANGKFSGFAPKCVDPCQMMDCIPHSVCSVKNGEARCDCVTGYSLGPGGQCNQIFPCERKPCDANAKCTDIDVKRYKCDCNYGYTGNGKVCRKLKPCELEPCDVNAKCTDIDDRRYTCDCLPGYKGDGKKCTKMYPCELNPCHEMADCVNINHTHYRCDCKTGYRGSGKYCERITCPVPPFPDNGKYRPIQKTYPMGSTITYECNYGYMLAGYSERNCTANGTFNGFTICLDLCQMVECIPHSVCSVKNGEAVCDCVTGYSLGPEGQCNEVFPCERNPCDANAKCTDIDVKRYKCDCNYGYTGNGKVCRKLTPCELEPCDVNAICTDIDDRRYITCDCLPGYKGDGKKCTRITCPVPPFPSNGKYRPVQKTYPMGSTITYECDYGYMLVGFNERNCTAEGTFNGFVLCDKIDPCELMDCPPHSMCSVKNGEAVCDCVTGYFLGRGGQCNGITCPVPPFPANGNYRPVQKTFPMGSTITYECDEGYKLTGYRVRKCSANGRFSGFTKCVDLCQLVDCIPNSMCSVKNGEAVCECITGYSLGPGGQCKEIPTTAPPTTPPTTPPRSCKDACGAYGFGNVCACDAACMRARNCCYDYTLYCGSGYSRK